MIEVLFQGASLAGELVERTSNTLRVQEIVRLSLTPAFLLAAIGAVMNVMVARLTWVANRIERIQQRIEDGKAGNGETRELPTLQKRRSFAQRAVMFSTAAALSICIVIALLFVSAFIKTQIGTITAIAWILTMCLLISGLLFFLLETRLAAKRQR